VQKESFQIRIHCVFLSFSESAYQGHILPSFHRGVIIATENAYNSLRSPVFVIPDTDVGMCSRKWFMERIMNWDFYIRFMPNHLTAHKKPDVFSCSWKCDCVFFIGRHYVMPWTKWPSSPFLRMETALVSKMFSENVLRSSVDSPVWVPY